jgi:hypothetical protein
VATGILPVNNRLSKMLQPARQRSPEAREVEAASLPLPGKSVSSGVSPLKGNYRFGEEDATENRVYYTRRS